MLPRSDETVSDPPFVSSVSRVIGPVGRFFPIVILTKEGSLLVAQGRERNERGASFLR
jgi:hypothetical protein